MDGSDETNTRGDEFHNQGFGDNLIFSFNSERGRKEINLEREVKWISVGTIVQVPYRMTPPHHLGISRCCTKHKL
jgi:hypothetical protein